MKWLGLLFVLFSLNSYGQCKTYLKNPKGEIINCTDSAGKRQGYWLLRVEPSRGNPGYDEEGHYVDGRKEGTWYQYSKMGDMIAHERYKWGMKDGSNQYFNITVGLIREESWLAVNPSDPFVEIEVEDVYNPGTFTKTRVKMEAKSYKHGTWRMYDPQTGALVASETYYMNETEAERKKKQLAASGGKTAASDTTKPAAKKIVPKEVQEFEKKNSGKKKVKIRDGRTGG